MGNRAQDRPEGRAIDWQTDVTVQVRDGELTEQGWSCRVNLMDHEGKSDSYRVLSTWQALSSMSYKCLLLKTTQEETEAQIVLGNG